VARPNILLITTDEERYHLPRPDGYSLPGHERLAVLMLVPVISRPIGVTFPIWVLATSIALLIARPPERSLDEPADARPFDTGPVDVGP